ncbi:MAG: hypothetical protein JJ868_19680 [Shimia sp.]|uniref:hypothetical protein n=1 Tax=Shimia sp. TaxID=1954381 RepID=UPI001B20E58D|nr:hypothetical protein [Shimia sp.]MBO6899585.1 hypothetical protein [Shimia sp.]
MPLDGNQWVLTLEITKATISFSQAAIRSLVLINGGAAIAVMTFIGGYPSEQKAIVLALSGSLLYFSVGVALAAFVGGCAYVTQFLYDGSTGKVSRWGVFFHILAVICAMISLTLFVLGLLGAFWGFTGALRP